MKVNDSLRFLIARRAKKVHIMTPRKTLLLALSRNRPPILDDAIYRDSTVIRLY